LPFDELTWISGGSVFENQMKHGPRDSRESEGHIASVNESPRKTLGFQTAAEMFSQCVASTG